MKVAVKGGGGPGGLLRPLLLLDEAQELAPPVAAEFQQHAVRFASALECGAGR